MWLPSLLTGEETKSSGGHKDSQDPNQGWSGPGQCLSHCSTRPLLAVMGKDSVRATQAQRTTSGPNQSNSRHSVLCPYFISEGITNTVPQGLAVKMKLTEG